ncbi:outer membrane efflux protein [Burkholderia ambifaria IOP40-10]|uniref:Outer membrane efflux protein n=1 Tax=Burkholderia ambifaria IOP40-10 TaxID=396596 RepID=B1FQP0_9BURK|nr:outer membrane efflux protein [Burkholderia ambifaria IOP40-10]
MTAPFTDFLRAMNGGWTAGPALSLPIFEGGRLRAQLGAANAGYDQAVERYNQTVVGALKDIADQVVRIRSLDTQKKDAARSVAANDRSYQLSREGFRRGLTDYVNVLIAQQQLLRAQETAARIDAERLAAHAQLMAALGGGVETGQDGRDGHPSGDHPSRDESAVGAAAPAAASGAKPGAAVARPAQVATAGASAMPAAR